MRRFLVLSFIGLVAALALPANSVPLPGPFNDPEEACDLQSLSPAAAHVPVIDPDDKIFIDVFLLADRNITQARASTILAGAKESYEPLGLTLRVSGTKKVGFKGTGAFDLIDQARDLFPDGERPAGTDAVLLLTSADIEAAPAGKAVAGLAACVGGVGSPSRAFLVAEDPGENTAFRVGPAKTYDNIPAKILAHELGHLLGVHHHYANCVEGIPSEADEGEVSACTLMTNFADVISINFGTLESAVARGYAEEYARP